MQNNNNKKMKEMVRKVAGRLPQPILLLETQFSIKILELLTWRLSRTPDVAAVKVAMAGFFSAIGNLIWVDLTKHDSSKLKFLL